MAKPVTTASVASSTRLFRLGLRLMYPAKIPSRAGFGYVSKFGGEVEKSSLVLDDVLLEAFHGNSL